MEYQEELKRKYRLDCFIGYSMFGAVLCYGVMAFLIRRTFGAPPIPSQDVQNIRYFFWMITIVLFVSVPYAKKWILQSSRPVIFTGMETPGPASLLMQKFLTARLAGYMVSETLALLGLLLFMITKNFKDFYSLACLSVISLVLQLPQYSQWETWLKRQTERFPGA